MSTIEQIRLLAVKIEKAVETIKAFKAENLQLKEELAKAKAREEELENLVASYKSGSEDVDDGIAYAIKLLDEIELEDSAAAPEIIPAAELNRAQAENFTLSAQEEESLDIDLDNSSNEQLNIF